MTILLTAIVMWLSANFDLPATADHPHIEFASPKTIATLRYHAFLPEQRSGISSVEDQAIKDQAIKDQAMARAQRDVVAVYDDAARTIYLPDSWAGSTPAELSVLVHEMVHHLQNLAALKFECPQAREQLAYEAQEKWLALFGHDLAGDFEIDRFTVFVNTRCMQ